MTHYPYSGMIPNLVIDAYQPERGTLWTAIKVVCAVCRVSTVELSSKSRLRRIVTGRQMLCYILKHNTSMTLKEIAHWIGGRDHTTVIHSINTARDLRRTDQHFALMLDQIEQQL